MSKQLLRTPRNIVTFPRKLRDAIPDQELCVGRALELASADARPEHSTLRGRRVQLRLEVCETGKFAVLMDLDVNAAKALAQMALDAAEQAEKLPPAKVWTI